MYYCHRVATQLQLNISYHIHLGYYLDVQLVGIKITWFLTKQVVDFVSFSWRLDSMGNLYTALIVSTEVQFQTKAL